MRRRKGIGACETPKGIDACETTKGIDATIARCVLLTLEEGIDGDGSRRLCRSLVGVGDDTDVVVLLVGLLDSM